MKKKLVGLLMGASLVLAACGGDSGGGDTASADPQKLYEQKCSGCHGVDLTGGNFPALTKVGSKYSKEEIEKIIVDGKGGMPPGLYKGEEASKVAEWLSEKK
ncbi:cytochrome C551 [Bacillus sp. FJAT-27225]|uniref:cytochrome c551 n=1 Tax=Bacillus sp. FJAT-27225 TaxID=1743144 RepID=UPI00080C31C0|nr:cytochrome c [Bacillus sp. FJAT-27225]OCA88239.1 cytochrome C551 [Bacillus sp. FJAT-27225]